MQFPVSRKFRTIGAVPAVTQTPSTRVNPNFEIIDATQHPIWKWWHEENCRRKAEKVGQEGSEASAEGGDAVGGDQAPIRA